MAKRKPKAAAVPDNPWPGILHDLRKFYGIEQTEAAARAKCPIGTWRNWEQGRRWPKDQIQLLLELAFPEFFRKKT